MKILKIILAVIAVAIIGFATYNATLEKEYAVSRSTIMNVDAHIVRELVSDFSTWHSWSAWFEADSTMEYTLGDNHTGKGATYSWTSENMGSGAMEILSLSENSMETKIEFDGQGTSNGHWKFETIEDGVTKVTWGFSGEMPLMMRWMGAQMDKWVGPDFEKGLANLTALSEKEAINQKVAEKMTKQPVE
jgi:hypothetical protein